MGTDKIGVSSFINQTLVSINQSGATNNNNPQAVVDNILKLN